MSNLYGQEGWLEPVLLWRQQPQTQAKVAQLKRQADSKALWLACFKAVDDCVAKHYQWKNGRLRRNDPD